MLNQSRLLVAVLGACLLAACVTTPQERAARVQRDVEDMIQVQGPACEKLGYTADTDPWRECVLKLGQHERLQYQSRAYSTSCIGHRGFYNCTSF